jgi:hypothetical protein
MVISDGRDDCAHLVTIADQYLLYVDNFQNDLMPSEVTGMGI